MRMNCTVPEKSCLRRVCYKAAEAIKKAGLPRFTLGPKEGFIICPLINKKIMARISTAWRLALPRMVGVQNPTAALPCNNTATHSAAR